LTDSAYDEGHFTLESNRRRIFRRNGGNIKSETLYFSKYFTNYSALTIGVPTDSARGKE